MRQPFKLSAETNVILESGENGEKGKFQLWVQKDNKIQEVLSKLELFRINLDDQIKIFEHPLETGTVIVDHMILEPKQANIQAYISLDDDKTLRQLEQLYLTGEKMTLRSENNVIENAIIKSKPREVVSGVLDKTLYSIVFREVEEKEPVYVSMPPRKVANTGASSRVNSGVKQAQTTKQVKKSWLSSLLKGGRT